MQVLISITRVRIARVADILRNALPRSYGLDKSLDMQAIPYPRAVGGLWHLLAPGLGRSNDTWQWHRPAQPRFDHDSRPAVIKPPRSIQLLQFRGRPPAALFSSRSNGRRALKIPTISVRGHDRMADGNGDFGQPPPGSWSIFLRLPLPRHPSEAESVKRKRRPAQAPYCRPTPARSGSNGCWLAEIWLCRPSFGSVGQVVSLGFFQQGPPVDRLHWTKIPVPHLVSVLRSFPVSAPWRRRARPEAPTLNTVIAESSCARCDNWTASAPVRALEACPRAGSTTRQPRKMSTRSRQGAGPQAPEAGGQSADRRPAKTCSDIIRRPAIALDCRRRREPRPAAD